MKTFQRGFVTFLLFVSFTAFFVMCSSAAPLPFPHDGKLNLYATHLNESLEITYLKPDGSWDEAAYQKINYLLRSRTDQKVHDINKNLIELLDHLQDHFGANTIEVICGYRSPEFNQKLKSQGKNVAEESRHLKGEAVDIHIDEVREDTLRDYVASLGLFHARYYGMNLMVHIQPGKGTQSTASELVQNTSIGIFNQETSVALRTNKLFYALSDPLEVAVDRIDQMEQGPKIILSLQKFDRGQWITIPLAQIVINKSPTSNFLTKQNVNFGDIDFSGTTHSQYGKFRLRFEGKTNAHVWQNSNEFYIKKM